MLAILINNFVSGQLDCQIIHCPPRHARAPEGESGSVCLHQPRQVTSDMMWPHDVTLTRLPGASSWPPGGWAGRAGAPWWPSCWSRAGTCWPWTRRGPATPTASSGARRARAWSVLIKTISDSVERDTRPRLCMRLWTPSGRSSLSFTSMRTRARTSTLPSGIRINDPKMTSWAGEGDVDQETRGIRQYWRFKILFRSSIDLSKLQREVSHQIWLNLEDGAGKLFLIVTISGENWVKIRFWSTQQKIFYQEPPAMTVRLFYPTGITVTGQRRWEREISVWRTRSRCLTMLDHWSSKCTEPKAFMLQTWEVLLTHFVFSN